MRNMSFSLTTPQFLDGSKSVTRRLGWLLLRPGDRVMGVKKAMGLKPGEKIERLGEIEIVSVRMESLALITKSECVSEGFPDMSPAEFIEMFCLHMGCASNQIVHRIEFKRV